jgi:mannose-1-phosphate guanylyltransferase
MKSSFGKLNSKANAVGVVMAGGYGTRFWPHSRRSRPKQFLPLAGGEETLIQATARRVSLVTGEGAVLVVSGEEHQSLLTAQLPGVAHLLEPRGRNTAPCVGFAAQRVLKEVGDVPMICLPADHFIQRDEAFADVLRDGVKLAAEDELLITVGIRPTAPETGYGYICRGESLSQGRAAAVERFVEKPSREKALEYLASGRYLWNAGIFVWRPSVILRAIQQFLPELHVHLQKIGDSLQSPNERELIASEFEKIKPVSIDVGVMERAENALVLEGESFSWSDIGSWSAWVDCALSNSVESAQQDVSQNLLLAEGLLVDCRGTTVLADEGVNTDEEVSSVPRESAHQKRRFIAGVGLDNLIIVDTTDALLVVAKDLSQEVKKVVDFLESKGRFDLLK